MNIALSDPTIQLPAGPPEDATGHWRVSLAEIDALGRKAARGAGYSWGMAEEAGRAARWLAAYRQPGPEALCALLEAVDRRVADHAPETAGAAWRARGAWLCPVSTGAALSDRAESIAAGTAVDLGSVIHPLLLVPFLSRAARDLACCFRLEAPGLVMVATPDGPATTDWDPLGAKRIEHLRVTGGGDAKCAPARPGAAPWGVPVETWRALDRFAHRTYAPATEASRAGAGGRDAD